MKPIDSPWYHATGLPKTYFRCGHCGRESSYSTGYHLERGGHDVVISICNSCNRPTFIENTVRIPGEPVGREVKHLKDNVGPLWLEARNAARANACSACVMVCRSIIMHVAVEKGATPNGRFAAYVDYLATHHHVPVGAKGWVDRIRVLANDAAHELVVMTPAQMKLAMLFTEKLLEMTYELEGELAAAT